MSYTTMFKVVGNELHEVREFSNSHGCAPRVWSRLSEKYFGDPYAWSLSFGGKEDKFRKLWTMDLPSPERAALDFTADYAIVAPEHAPWLASELEEFARMYPVPGCVDHLPAIASELRKRLPMDNNRGFCWHQTSVSENPWMEQKVCSKCGNPDDDGEFRLIDFEGEHKKQILWLEPETELTT